MSYEGVVNRMARVLKRAKVPYMITGDLAANYYGCPRVTYDLDLVVELDEPSARRLAALTAKARFRVHKSKTLALVEVGNRFVMESWEKYRVDFWLIRTDFDKMVFGRRKRAKIFGTSTWVVSPEDLILQKLRAARAIDLEDVQAILARQRGRLDMGHLKHWAALLDVLDLLRKQMKEAGVGG